MFLLYYRFILNTNTTVSDFQIIKSFLFCFRINSQQNKNIRVNYSCFFLLGSCTYVRQTKGEYSSNNIIDYMIVEPHKYVSIIILRRNFEKPSNVSFFLIQRFHRSFFYPRWDKNHGSRLLIGNVRKMQISKQLIFWWKNPFVKNYFLRIALYYM